MSIVATDLKFFQSDSEGSAGGPMSMIEIPQGKMELIFKDTPRQFLIDGGATYKKIFVVNTNQSAALSAAMAYTLLQPTSGERLALALGDPTDTDPTPLQFQEYGTYEAGLSLGDIAVDQAVAIWMRRFTPAGLENFEDITAFFQLVVKGLTP